MKLGIILAVLAVFNLAGWIVSRGVASIQYDQVCGGHLKRAADANTVDLATQELQTAINHLETNKMTSGYTTALLWQTPNEDVGFWYQNLKASLNELKSMKADAAPLERSNMLMKLRETLLDNDKVTQPPGIEIFPKNTIYAT